MYRKIAVYLLLVALSFSAGWFLNSYYRSAKFAETPIVQIKPRPLDKYTFENLRNTEFKPSEIVKEEVIKEDADFTSYLVSFTFDPSLSGRSEKKVTGQINIPNNPGKYPLVVMFRGYVDPSIYQTGVGTLRASEFFAKNEFITVAPDFLGYAGSSQNAVDIFESRFQTYITALVLMRSLHSIEEWDQENIFLWGHSNGGQIALTYLAITQNEVPSTLWAPVTKPFPYSILYYTDESEDKGKFIRRKLAEFEETYDVDLYSLHKFMDSIKAPLVLHQGTNDSAVPKAWSDEFSRAILNSNLELEYYVYPGADHNLNPSWDTVVARDLAFFTKHLQKK